MGNSGSVDTNSKEVEDYVEKIKFSRELDISRRVTHSQFLKHVDDESNEACLSDLPWSILEPVNFYNRVDASFNAITNFSTQIPYRLPHLVHLNLSYNFIQSIPPSIALLFHLKELLLRNNKLTSVPKELSQLPFLELLDLSHNRLEFLPQNLGSLPSIVSINVSNNCLTALPLSLGNCKNLKVLLAFRNICSSPPQEVCNRGSDTLLDYLRKLAPAITVPSFNQFRRVRLNTTQSPTLQDPRGVYSRSQTRTDVPVNRVRTPLLPPLDASKYELNVVEDKIIGLIYGAVLGDSLGVGTEFLLQDELKFYYGNERLRHQNFVQDEHRSHFIKGEWTCASDLMLLVMESMLQWAGVVDELDLAEKLIQYKRTGIKDLHRSPPFITSVVLKAVLNEPDFSADPHGVAHKVAFSYNRAVAEDLHMLPMALFTGVPFFHNLDEVCSTAERVCKTTHNHELVKAAGTALAVIIACILQGKNSEQISQDAFDYGSRHLSSQEDLDQWWNLTNSHAYAANEDSAFTVVSAVNYCLSQNISSQIDFDKTLQKILFHGGQARLYGAVCGAVMGCQLGFSSLNSHWIEGMDGKQITWLNEKINLLLDMMGLP